MIKKIKTTLNYYAKMTSSINTHSKNININLNKNSKLILGELENINKVIMEGKKDNNITEFQNKTKFSIITAAYNAEKYVDDYFNSLINQSYFENIEIIIVNDGSTDKTVEIVEKWINNTPLNIKLFSQENCGQNVARNYGLQFAQNEWVTFIDIDDFVSHDYFYNVTAAMVKNCSKSPAIYVANLKYFNEDQKKVMDSHPLRYKFSKSSESHTVDLLEEPSFFNLSMSKTFFRKSLIKVNSLTLKNIKPQFEDALFLNEYLLKTNNFSICYVSNATYFYRKRSSNDSTLNKARFNPEKYTGLLNNAYIALLKMYYDQYNIVPKFVQNMIIYDLSWNLKEMESAKIELTSDQRKIREDYLKEIFSYIEFSEIESSWKHLWKLYQIGINNRYYGNTGNSKAGAYYFYESNDYKKIELISSNDEWEIIFNGVSHRLNELDYRIYEEKMNGEFFVNRYFVKIPKKEVKFLYEGVEIPISNNRSDYQKVNFNTNSLCIFYDRQNKADDNAEVFYEYMRVNHKEYENMYFAIDKDSKDYSRLEMKGFKLIDYSSDEFIKLYRKADYIISSGFDKKIENVKGMRYPKFSSRAKFIFLQHGIITDDLKEWFSGKRVDKIVTSCDFEYNNLVNKYTFFEEEIIKTGLPRYDKLYSQPKNEILVQFTWRMQYKDYSTVQLMETQYYQDIINLLGNEKLIHMLKEKNYIVKFIPHPEINKHIKLFEHLSNDVIKILNIEDITFRDQFASAKLMVTDYSSVFTDFAYLRKKVIYLQSDIEEFYKGHLYDPELDYEIDGLGPVVNNVEALILELESSIKNDCKVDEIYLNRIDNFFAFDDKQNCRRLYNELLKM